MTAPRRVDVEVVKTEPLRPDEWSLKHAIDIGGGDYITYREYLERHQPYHWRARAGNNEQIAQGESYFHATDAVDTVRLLADPATTVTLTVDGETEVLREGNSERLAEVLLAEVKRLRANLAAMPSAIRAYATSQSDGYGHGVVDGSAIAELRELARAADDIVDYAATHPAVRGE